MSDAKFIAAPGVTELDTNVAATLRSRRLIFIRNLLLGIGFTIALLLM